MPLQLYTYINAYRIFDTTDRTDRTDRTDKTDIPVHLWRASFAILSVFFLYSFLFLLSQHWSNTLIYLTQVCKALTLMELIYVTYAKTWMKSENRFDFLLDFVAKWSQELRLYSFLKKRLKTTWASDFPISGSLTLIKASSLMPLPKLDLECEYICVESLRCHIENSKLVLV